MDFDLKDLNPGVEFLFDENDPEKGSVTLRACPQEKLSAIEKITDTVKVKFRRGQKYDVTKRNDKKYDSLFWDYIIVDWSGVTDKGKKMICNAANKVKLMNRSVYFSGFVADCLEQLGEAQIKKQKETEKN